MSTGKPGWIDTIPQPYLREFRDDVIQVAWNRDSKTTIVQIAKDFGIHEGTLNKWIRQPYYRWLAAAISEAVVLEAYR